MAHSSAEHFKRALLCQIPWLLGGIVSLIGGSLFYSMPLPVMLGLPLLAGILPGAVAYFVLGATTPIARTSRFVMLLIAVAPVALAVLICFSIASGLTLVALLVQLASVMVCAASLPLVIAKLSLRSNSA